MKPIIALSAIYTLVVASPALAYIDPVTGSFALQAIIGGFATVLVLVRRVREKILGFLGLRETKDKISDNKPKS